MFGSSPQPEILNVFQQNIVLKSCHRAYFLFALTHVSQSARKNIGNVIGNTRSLLVVQLLGFIFLITKIKKTYLQN